MEKLELTALGKFVNRHSTSALIPVWREVIKLIVHNADEDGDWQLIAQCLKAGATELLETDILYEIINDIDAHSSGGVDPKED